MQMRQNGQSIQREVSLTKCTAYRTAGHAHVTDLGGPSDHVLDEVPMTRGIDDGHIVLAGFKLPQGDVDGNATLPFCLQLVQNPGILERPLPHLRNKQIAIHSSLAWL